MNGIGNIMIIDDSPLDRLIITQLLKKRFSRIKIFEMDDGIDAAKNLIKYDIQVCILDIMLPGKNGYQILKELKANKNTKDIPVIIFTAMDDTASIERALTLGALDYFTKPISEESMKISLPLKIKNAIELYKRNKQISYLSYHDKLTGLNNRRFFEDEMIRLDNENYYPLSFIMGDINGLKISNDIFGHEAGDKLLKAIASVLKRSCNRGNVISRWGGDEFVIMLPKTDRDKVEKICEKIHTSCKQYKGSSISLSISLGYATKKDTFEDITQILKMAENNMYHHKLLEGTSSHSSIIGSLRSTLQEKNLETSEHIDRLALLSRKLGITLGLSENELDNIYLLALLHDIGKIALNDSLLMKPEPLTEAEFEIIKSHSEIGYRIAKSIPELTHIASCILHHHEWWNGTGYPSGLIGADIPKYARIVSIIDAYDAMTNARGYKIAMSSEDAIKEIKKNAGIQFDPQIVEAFCEAMNNKNMEVC